MTLYRISLAMTCASLLGSCTEQAPPDGAGSQSRAEGKADAATNGVRMNGVRMNGTALNGVRMNGVRMNGVALSGLRVNGAQLEASTASGSRLRGAALVGAELTGEMDDGSTARVRIDGVRRGAPSNSELYFYTASLLRGDAWLPVCQDATGRAVEAIPLSGTWDPREGVPGGGSKRRDGETFTFACRGGALAKCVEGGYHPWKSALHDDLHQTCTRLIRADYCGNGKPFTADGRPINLYDAHGIQTDTHAWTFEAEWTTAGARCVTRERVNALRLELLNARIETGVPECILSRISLTCGDRAHFDSNVLLMNEFQSTYLSVALSL